MKFKLNVVLILVCMTLMTACGGGGISKEVLIGQKWKIDVDALEKEIDGLVDKMADEAEKTKAKEQLTVLKPMLKGFIEPVKIEFKEDGSITGEGLGEASEADAKWSLDGGNLVLEADGNKINLAISGSAKSMKLTLTKEELQKSAEKNGNPMPADVEKMLEGIDAISVTLLPAE